MITTLTAANQTERRLLEYLQANASAPLIEKINAGKKTLAGALAYLKGEAQKLANGESSVCVDDATVFGWVVHYFEEDHIAESPKPASKTTVRLPSATAKTTAKATRKPKKVVPAATAAPVEPVAASQPVVKQLSMMEALFGGV